MADKKLTAEERFSKLHEAAKRRDSYHIEAAKVELSEQIYLVMESAGVTEAELARRIGASRAYVNKALQGATNFTIESLVKIGRALEREFKFEFAINETEVELDADITYVTIEEPVEQPVVAVIGSAYGSNIYSFSDYKASKRVDLETAVQPVQEARYAAI